MNEYFYVAKVFISQFSKYHILKIAYAKIILRQARITKDVTERKLKHHNTKASCTNKNGMEEKC